MSKYYGKVGYITTEEVKPGIYKPVVTEKQYYGDVTSEKMLWQNSQSVNDDINISVEISIMADPYAYEHFSGIKYVEYMGAKWKVNSITPGRPRIILHLGGLYNGQ